MAGHSASLWQGDKLLVFGGENEHRIFLTDVIIFEIKSAQWAVPDITGPVPRGRARHAAVIHDDKLYVSGGMGGMESTVLDDICYLDLKTWTWSRAWKFVPRYDHASWVWNGRLWIFGGINRDKERMSEIWWLDLRGSPGFDQSTAYGTGNRPMLTGRPRALGLNAAQPVTAGATGSSGYVANSSVQSTPNPVLWPRSHRAAPGSISSLKFVSSPNLPAQALGTHFHVFTSGCLLDFMTPVSAMSCETSLSALELDTLRWQKLVDGRDLFVSGFRWEYCVMNPDGTHAWLIGGPNDMNQDGAGGGSDGEYLSDVLPIDLRKFGLLGNELATESYLEPKLPSSDANVASPLTGIGADLSRTFDQPPESGSGADFMVTAERDEVEDGGDEPMEEPNMRDSQTVSPPIHVHKLILHARWPHFARLWASQMAEFHSKKMHIPEPYSAVRAFLFYLYTDSIAANPQNGPSLADVAGMLVMANIYDMPRLRLLCVNRLNKELDVVHAALVWERSLTASDEWLKRRAANYCMLHWGRVVRTHAFRSLSRSKLVQLCEEAEPDGRVIGAEEAEVLGTKRAHGGNGWGHRPPACTHVITITDDEGEDDGEDEGMDVN